MNIKNFLICILTLNILTLCNPTFAILFNYIDTNSIIVSAEEELEIFTDISNSNIKFTIKENTITLIECPIINNKLNIPATVNLNNGEEYPLTQINSQAFLNYKDTIESITLPQYISIPTNCFSDFKNLTTVTFFEHSFNLENAIEKKCNDILKVNTTQIAANAFSNCPKLTTINFPESYKGRINNDAFNKTPWFINFTTNANTKDVISPNIYEKYLVIGGQLLNYWATNDNTTMHIPADVKYILDYTLKYNTYMPQITHIYTEDEVKDFGWQNFINTQWYKNWLYINADSEEEDPNRSEYLMIPTKNNKNYIYAANIKTSTLNIPNNTYALGNAIFYENTFLQYVTLPNDLKYINVNTFAKCYNLKSINIPPTISHIEHFAFNKCFKLGTEDGYLTIPNIEDIDLNDTDIHISEYAFPCYKTITNIKLPNKELNIDYFTIQTHDNKKFISVNGQVILENATSQDTFILQMASNLNKSKAVLELLKTYVHDFTLNELNINTTDTYIANKINSNLLTDAEKLSILADWLDNNIDYAWFYASRLDQGALAGLFYKYCVCAGYAQIVQFFCDEVGIKNFIVANTVHAWNLVYIEDEKYTGWYHYDQTAGANTYLASKKHYPKETWYIEEYYDDYENYCNLGIIDDSTKQEYKNTATYSTKQEDEKEVSKYSFDIKTDTDYPSYRIEALYNENIKKIELYKTIDTTEIKLYDLKIKYFSDATKYSDLAIPANNDNYSIKITYTNNFTDTIKIKPLNECLLDETFDKELTDSKSYPYSFCILNDNNMFDYNIKLRNTHSIKAYSYVYNIDTLTTKINFTSKEFKITLEDNKNNIYNSTTNVDDIYSFIVPANKNLSINIYDKNTDTLIHTFKDMNITEETLVNKDFETPMFISNTKIDDNNYTINVTPCYKYTFQPISNNAYDYNVRVYSVWDAEGSYISTVNSPREFPNYTDIDENGNIRVIVKPETRFEPQYKAKITTSPDDTPIIFDLDLDQENTQHIKALMPNRDLTTPFEISVTPNAADYGTLVTITDYLSGDVNMDNHTNELDARIISNFVVQNYNFIQTGALGNISLRYGNMTINGDISANNKLFVSSPSANFNGIVSAKEISTQGNVNMPRTSDIIIDTETIFSDEAIREIYFENADETYINTHYTKHTYAANHNNELMNINLNSTLMADSIDISKDNDYDTLNISLNNNIYSNNNIYIKGNVQNASTCVLYSKSGNITIDTDNFSFSGLIYAPHGTVTIKGKNINITGTIIASELNIDGETLNFNILDNIFKYTNISETYKNTLANIKDDPLTILKMFIADVNNDTKVTSTDSLTVLQIVENLIW